MKQTQNNEMDLLLRGLARREGARSADSEDHSAKHMDADELNAYAEQALPAPARMRYTSHLADCDSCRKIVSELASASGANVSDHSVSQETSGLRQKFAAFFSPRVLRFAMPALALFAFIAVGLIALKQQTSSEIAMNERRATSTTAGSATRPADSVAEQQESVAINSAVNDKRGLYDSPTESAKDKDNIAKSDDRRESSGVSTSTDSASAPAGRDASPGKAAGAVAQPSYAPEPAAAPPPKVQTTDTVAQTEVAARQKKEADKNNEEPAREQEGARARADESQNQVARPQTAKSAPAAPSEEKRRAPEMGKLASGVGAKAKDDEAETRTVSGRRFRRQGGVWIDTAFQSSTATTFLSRGSEQFRALVADEPGIRDIAAQLSGEVVVVWKGRAYRIR
ncbi:MAG: hypothetical protein ND895_09300 [Pyrinomonadaceae bacterium]|nr:hypothetical protein [Pyrinomonadaceae bacterium]